MPLNPETRLQMIAVDDIGEFAALAFQRPGHWQGRAVELAGDELSMTELAQVFSRMSGRDVRYLQVPWDQFEKRAGRDVTLMFQWRRMWVSTWTSDPSAPSTRISCPSTAG